MNIILYCLNNFISLTFVELAHILWQRKLVWRILILTSSSPFWDNLLFLSGVCNTEALDQSLSWSLYMWHSLLTKGLVLPSFQKNLSELYLCIIFFYSLCWMVLPTFHSYHFLLSFQLPSSNYLMPFHHAIHLTTTQAYSVFFSFRFKAFFFFLIFIFIYLAAQSLSCGTWDLVP